MTAAPPTVFVSYSHRDEAWKRRLVTHLEVLEFEGAVDVWDDRRIAAGDGWRPEIEQAIERASVAVLIISPDFLTSRFIREQELTRILERRSRQQLRVVPVIARPCAWQAVAALQGIQARPVDGRALSGGNGNQIDTDLSDLAIEIRDLLTGTAHDPTSKREPSRAATTAEETAGHAVEAHSARPRGRVGGAGRQRMSLVLGLCLPSAAAALLAWGATTWRVPTRVSVDVITRRISFDVTGREGPSLLNANSQFSDLTIERCGTVSFQAEEFEIVPVSGDHERPISYSGPVRLNCRDAQAQIALSSRHEQQTDSPGDRVKPSPVGALDNLRLHEGATVVLDVVESVFTIDVSTAQRLDLPIHAPFFLTPTIVEVEIPSGFALIPTYRVRVPESNRLIHVEGTERGIVMIVTPVAEDADEFFNTDMRLPVANVKFLDEVLNERVLTSPFVRDGTLSYPGYSIAALTVPRAQFFVPGRVAAMEITGIAFAPDGPGFRVTMEGLLNEGAIGTPGTSDAGGADGHWNDPRLTAYQVFRYGPLWGIVAAIAVWVLATTWIGYERWKKLVA